MKDLEEILKQMRRLMRLSLGIGALLVVVLALKFNLIDLSFLHALDEAEVVQAPVADTALYGTLDEQSGLIVDKGLNVVKANCGACHSTFLVAQNRLTRQGWQDLIKWMQATQNLWDLGEQEAVILDYLEKNCAPKSSGRRKSLANVEWYELNE
ncbi:MAG TPA: monoheme cytochrome C [Flavobacteriales bacterium]|nr:monoheme cytochrome C [Flavobacteriales bacterium]